LVSNLTTIKQLFDFAKSCFLQFEDAYDAKVDAQALLSAVLDKPTSFLSTWPEKHLSAEQQTLFLSFVKRREQGEPVAFIVGKQQFWSLDFFVAPCTLIPRPDTETLVEAVLSNNQAVQLSLLDLGTGTGAIALALASEHQTWQVDAVDFSAETVQLARSNAEQLRLTQVDIYQSDWFSNISNSKRFDIIVSNPPYIASDDKHLAQGDVRFEPKSALVADEQGFADIRHIIDKSRDYLTVNGQLYLEHGFEQHQGVQQLFAEYGYGNIKTYNDYGGNPRITIGINTTS